MYAKLYGATLHGIDGCIITVEVDISQGLPVFDIVGLPNQSVKEARERVRLSDCFRDSACIRTDKGA